ncbi:hypothetical protein A3A21_02315 [Candidatus Jorgensenbacteria bacterium RIFCSPLOWO2_01_FULL_45_25b]|uniref:Uncharacterized protein n=1 Tax=Candidatus Jorgensenbacteria bacterium RIFCSPLOWO2_01_FULL_45_25b TaxID=1798471 RepID=A0A1F6C196_9BACT|nr:MAG: hypothetical protein A3A21_02315 [Candidatus Jorgensenbacteria bacterium RIFCSPLOWO2_01_FULL_45_25b]
MQKQQKVIIVIAVLIVALLVVVGVMTKKDREALKEQKRGGEEALQKTAEEIKREKEIFVEEVPKFVELTKPAESSPVSPTAEGGEENTGAKLGIFDLMMSKDGYAPNQLAVKQGDIVQIRLTAVDGDYDFSIPYNGIYKLIKKGETSMVSFKAADAGVLGFECKDKCPSGEKGKGKLIVAP